MRNISLYRMKQKLTEKQFAMFSEWIDEKPVKLFASGGMRSGKTFCLALMFILMIKRRENQNVQFGILGSSIATIQRNVISVMEEWLGIKIKIGKFNDFELFGNRIICFGATDKSCVGTIRGCTLAGAFINEISVIHWEGVKEIQDRCSLEGAQVIGDTNPCSLYEETYTEIFSKGDVYDDETGQCLQKCYHFTLLDNTTLPEIYIKSQLQRYPVGTVDYERNILGKYANKEGLVYYMFNERQHIIDAMPLGVGVEKYFMGQDYGYGAGHAGVLVVVAKLFSGQFVVVEATVEEGQSIEYWKEKALDYERRYNAKTIYADHARPDLIAEMRKTRLIVQNADKSVMLGIDYISELLNMGNLLFLKSLPSKVFEEFARYSWATGTKEEPKKEHDNFLDGLRYALYTEHKKNPQAGSLYGDVKPNVYYKTQYNPLNYKSRRG